MYISLRILNFASLLALVFGIFGKVGHLFNGSLFLTIGIIGASVAYIGRIYLDKKNKENSSNDSL